MHCIDVNTISRGPSARWATVAGTALALSLAGCGGAPAAPEPTPVATRAVPPAVAAVAPSGAVRLPPATTSRNWNDFKLQAAKRMVAASPNGSHTGKPQQMLLAVPVIEVELHSDGSIKNIDIMRRPSQAPETTQLAIDAIKRAAPFGDVSRLPKPWKFAETFLFNDDKRFKPRTLDAQ